MSESYSEVVGVSKLEVGYITTSIFISQKINKIVKIMPISCKATKTLCSFFYLLGADIWLDVSF